MGNRDIKKVEDNLRQIHSGIGSAFSKVRDELSMHLDSINQNTNEIQVLYGFLNELESKIDKVGERLDELSFLLNPKELYMDFDVKLTVREEELFLVLYTSSEPITAKTAARYLGLTEELVHTYAYQLISKSIPVKKEFVDNNELVYSLDSKFKDLQARKNLIPVNERVLAQLQMIKPVL